jgi:hypothetical protein
LASRQESLRFAAANNKHYSEIGRLNEEEILMPAVTGVLFKWPLNRQIRGRGYGAGMEAMSDKPAPRSP